VVAPKKPVLFFVGTTPELRTAAGWAVPPEAYQLYVRQVLTVSGTNLDPRYSLFIR